MLNLKKTNFMNKKNQIFSLFLVCCCFLISCATTDLDRALDDDQNGNTDRAIRRLGSYISKNKDGEWIKTSDKKINSLQAKRLSKNIQDILDSDDGSLSANELRKLQKKIKENQSWDPDDIIFGLVKAEIEQKIQKIDQDCESLEGVLNVFLQNKEEIKAYKTFNFIKEKDNLYNIAPLTEIKIIDIFTKNNDKVFLKNLELGNYEEIGDFFELLDAQYFAENHKAELKQKYLAMLDKKINPVIANLIKNKKYLSAYITNKETIDDKNFDKKIKKGIEKEIKENKKEIKEKDFQTLEGYLIVSPKLKKYVQKEYYNFVDKITLDDIFTELVIKNEGLDKNISPEVKMYIKEQITENALPIKVVKDKKGKADYAILIQLYPVEDEKLNGRINIKNLKTNQDLVIQNISSSYNYSIEEISIHKFVKKMMRVIRHTLKPDIDTMLKSARYYLRKKDFENFKTTTDKLILLNQIEPFESKEQQTLIKLLSEYERL